MVPIEGTPSHTRLVDIHGQLKGGALNTVKNFLRNKMAQSTLPTEEKLGYKSESAFYGAKLQTTANGHMYLNYRGALAKVDRAGDIVLRTTDDNVMKKPLALITRHPKAFLKQLVR